MGYWQISSASAKIVSDFSLETDGSRLVCRLPQRGACPPGPTAGAGWGRPGGTPKFQTVPSSPSNGLVQGRIVWRLLFF